MSEPTSSPSAAQGEPIGEQTQGDPADKPLGEGGEKALKAERERARALEKQLSEATTKLGEIEKAKLSDLERAQAEAADAKEAASKAAADVLRYRMAAKHQISEDDAELFLTGADEETLTKQAERLVARAPSTPGTPKPDLSQGGRGSKPTSTADAFAAAVESALH